MPQDAAAASSPGVRATVAAGAGTIIIDRPPANTYDLAALDALDAAITTVVTAGARGAVVRSASSKFFCAGAEMESLVSGDKKQALEIVRRASRVFDRFAAESCVFVALVAGHALGGGLEIALACDLRVAVTGGYRIGFPEVTLGLRPGIGATQRLPKLIGAAAALRLMTTGTTLLPEEAHRLGMLDTLSPRDEAEQRVEDVLRTLAAGGSLDQARQLLGVRAGQEH